MSTSNNTGTGADADSISSVDIFGALAASEPFVIDSGWSVDSSSNASFSIDCTSPAITRGEEMLVFGKFFGPTTDALMVMSEDVKMIPFIDKLGIIWLQISGSYSGDMKWAPYDRKKFYEFIDDKSDAQTFDDKLSKDEVLKILADPEMSGTE